LVEEKEKIRELKKNFGFLYMGGELIDKT